MLRPCAPKSICSRSQSISASSVAGAGFHLFGALTKFEGLVEERGFEQGLTGREMSIQRPDPDAGVAGDVLEDDVATRSVRRRPGWRPR
jgi:hypothetical protein